jgi:Zn finger protein HypA/HybF involved in hydrogenase expression
MTELYTDGNSIAGRLAEFLAADMTTTQRRCQSCRGEHPIAEHRAYQGAGAVLRCPQCGDVALRIAEVDGDVVLEWRGTYRARRTG